MCGRAPPIASRNATSVTRGAMTVRRRRWADLPEPARTAVQEQTGPVVDIRSAEVGLTSGLAARITTEGAAFFVKAAPAASPIAGHLLRERTANQALPSTVPAPQFLWTADVADWHLLLFEHAPGHEANLAPKSPDIPAAMDAVAALAVPCPWPGAPSVTAKATALLLGAEAFLADSPGLGDYEPLVKALDLNELDGTTLLHADLHAGNLLVDNDRCRVVDWSMACRGRGLGRRRPVDPSADRRRAHARRS